ncbi:L-asparaginase [Salmonella enterica]|nr:L-asparaginase [Salmonella enterica]
MVILSAKCHANQCETFRRATSRTGNGVVPLDKGQPGLVSDSLNPAKARVLLMTALTQTRNPELIQSYFSTY